jgi:uncharacterized protein YfiM (DUF2279 family)
MAQRRSDFFDLTLDTWFATLEAQQVIALRMAKLMAGGEAAARESRRMVSEKASTALKAQGDAAVAILTGAGAAVPKRTVAAYRRKVRANRRRLLKDYGL